MNEEENISNIEASLVTDFAQIKVEIGNVDELKAKENELFQIADILDRLNSIFKLRSKYSELYTLLSGSILIHYKKNNWAVWEQVLLILFNFHNFEAQRSEVWKFEIKQGTLRNIIHERTNFIEPIDDDRIKLTPEGLEYIINKLNEDMRNYNIEIERNDNDE